MMPGSPEQIDTTVVGIEAAKLMEDLIEDDLPEGSKIEEVGLVVSVRRPGFDGDEESVYFRCTSDRRLVQVGLFSVARGLAEEDD